MQVRQANYILTLTGCFMYETPYTLSGNAHGSVAEQYKRRTILTTDGTFPSCKARLLVKSKREIELTPLEVSITAISDRCNQLKNASESIPLNAKQLQLILQGTVRLQVNSGPMEIANAFLKSEVIGKYPLDRIQVLANQFSTFIEACSVALCKNKEVIGADQLEYHEDLEEGFLDLKQKLTPYLECVKAYTAKYKQNIIKKFILSFCPYVDIHQRHPINYLLCYHSLVFRPQLRHQLLLQPVPRQ